MTELDITYSQIGRSDANYPEVRCHPNPSTMVRITSNHHHGGPALYPYPPLPAGWCLWDIICDAILHYYLKCEMNHD
jgi:hypothetical protein